MIYIVSMHKAAIEFSKDQLEKVFKIFSSEYEILDHLSEETFEKLNKYDVVVGVLPIHIVERLNSMNVRTIVVQMPAIPSEMIGRELTINDMYTYNAHLTEYYVRKL